ncbi:hypothetical protein PG997_008611 [Apiospora hydei]|uniref:CorA-like transporter domain-containing protein n=1 Tax=Apiospora hydei TaxID=1337664 RepID=A0ABR1WFB8_9PEZI
MRYGSMDHTQEFLEKYQRHDEFPRTLVHDKYGHRSDYYKQQLDKHEEKIFCTANDDDGRSNKDVFVKIRDYETTDKLRVRNEHACRNEQELMEALGEDGTEQDWLSADAACRVILLETVKAQSRRLNLTKSMFTRIMTYHQVSSCFLNFVTFSGSMTGKSDLGLGGFRSESCIRKPKFISRKLDRSGRHIHVSYILKTIERNLLRGQVQAGDPDNEIEWIRPHTAVHHQFDLETGKSLWILTSPLIPVPQSGGEKPKGQNTIWRSHLNKPLNEFRKQKDQPFDISADRQVYTRQASPVDDEDLQKLYKFMDDADTCILRLEDNLQVISSLGAFYNKELKTEAAKEPRMTEWRDEREDIIDNFLAELDERQLELESVAQRARNLVGTAKSRESVISKVLQNQTNNVMLDLTKQGHEEAVVMGLFQAIAIFYLPMTVVSAVFSTDIVKFQDLEPGETQKWSRLALGTWFATSIGLTIVTLIISEVWKRWKREQNRVRLEGREQRPGAVMAAAAAAAAKSQTSTPSTASINGLSPPGSARTRRANGRIPLLPM